VLFNSFAFIVFLALILPVNFALRRRHRAQNTMLLVASYIFYGWWDWRFLGLIAMSTIVDYFVAKGIHASDDGLRRRLLLASSVATNLGILAYFKYAGFFAEELSSLLSPLGLATTDLELNVILPVGISFYTFQTMSYTIDVYRRDLEPCPNVADMALYVSFFPQLVAGPIERGTTLMPQIRMPRNVTSLQVEQGVGLIVLGYFKKVFVADNLGVIADSVFADPGAFAGIGVFVGIVAFALQIYADFSGYSDIARGVAKLLGFDLMVNFRVPYAALNPADFWSRWHISLSSWLRDYLYIPLGGNQISRYRTYTNLMITMLLGGLWHGAAWTFVLWGLYHGLLLSAYRFAGDLRGAKLTASDSSMSRALRWVVMTIFTLIGWVIFRATSIDNLLDVFGNIGFTLGPGARGIMIDLIFFGGPLVIYEWIVHRTGDLLVIDRLSTTARGVLYGAIVYVTIAFATGETAEFIYFKF